jgi:hypothetical protein
MLYSPISQPQHPRNHTSVQSCTLACQKTMVIFSVPSYIVESLEGSIYIEMKMPGAARQRSERVVSASSGFLKPFDDV